MRLDHDLLRLLLIDAEGGICDLTAYTPEQIDYHRYQLIDGELAHGAGYHTVGNKYPVGLINGLTYKGNAALDTIRSKEIWVLVQARVFETVGSTSFEVKVRLAREIIDRQIRAALPY